jgi:Protein of unknown function (DUF3237)
MVEPVLTEHLMTLEGTIGQPQVINDLIVFNVLGGSVKGPTISGEISPPAGDWIRVMPNGNWKLDVRFNITLDDDQPAFFYYSGIVCMTDEYLAKIEKGDTIYGDDIYFRSAPYVETASKKYDWLNNILCIGKIRSFGGGRVVYDIFKVL